jgi:G patch domain/KOW motif-containing protein
MEFALREAKRRRLEGALEDAPATEDVQKPACVIPIQLSNTGVDIERKKPLLLSNIPVLLGAMDDGARFQKDLAFRAQDISSNSVAYETVPIHEFGAAMLRGMGWTGTPKEETSHIIIPRERRVGLGATGKPPDAGGSNSRIIRGKKEQWDEKANEKVDFQKLSIGAFVWIRNSVYSGRRAKIIATSGISGLDKIRVMIEPEGSMIDLKRGDVVLLTEEQSEQIPWSGKINAWLRKGIRVRIISERVGGVSAYLQKGSVLDVKENGAASILLDCGGSILEGVKQKHLETVLPACGLSVMILSGTNSGKVANLLEKYKKEETALVRLENGSTLCVPMDQLAAPADISLKF